MCEPKRNSGKIDILEDIFKLSEAKRAARNKLFEAFIKTGGDKDNVLCSHESDYIQAYPNYEAYSSPLKLDSLGLHKGLLKFCRNLKSEQYPPKFAALL